MTKSIRVRVVRAIAALFLGLMGSLWAANPASAVGNSYWVATNTVNLGVCGPTGAAQTPGMYYQLCIRWLGNTVLKAPQWQGYLVTTNTGVNRQYVHVNSATLVGRKSVRPGELVDDFRDVGGCYTTAIYSRQSLTCRTSPAAFELFSRVYYQVRFEISGISYYSYTFCEITPPNNKCGR